MKPLFKRSLAAILIALIFLPLHSCTDIDPFRNYSVPFSVSVEGTVDNRNISAEIFCDPTEHITKEIYNLITVEYTAPESLKGITVSLRSDGKATVRLKESEEELPLYSNLAEPFLVFCNISDIVSREKNENGGERITCGSSEQQITYIFDENGMITEAFGMINEKNIVFSVKNYKDLSTNQK